MYHMYVNGLDFVFEVERKEPIQQKKYQFRHIVMYKNLSVKLGLVEVHRSNRKDLTFTGYKNREAIEQNHQHRSIVTKRENMMPTKWGCSCAFMRFFSGLPKHPLAGRENHHSTGPVPCSYPAFS